VQRFWSAIDENVRPEPASAGLSVATVSAGVALAATWLSREVLSVDLPFLFCIAAVLGIAVFLGLIAALWTTALTLVGTSTLSGLDGALVNVRSLVIVTLFCVIVAAGGGYLREARRREKQLSLGARRRERILETMFDATPAATLIIDDRDQVVTANQAACALFRRSRAEMMQPRFSDLMPGWASDTNSAHVLHSGSGGSRHVRVSTSSLKACGQSFRLTYIRDETEVVQAGEQLSMTQRELYQIARATALGQLGSSIAHELNQPLAFVANYAGAAQALLAASAPDVPAARSAIDDALAQVFRAATVLKRLRNFVGRRVTALSQIDVQEVIGEAVRLGDLAIRDAGASLETTFTGSRINVAAEPVQIQQVVLNLMLNAADAVQGREDRRIRLQASQAANGDFIMAVEDSGPGVPTASQQQIFEPFRSTKVEGVGIGLTICRSIIEAHQGRIWCDGSDALGGARFTISLPSGDPQEASNAA